MNPTDGRTGEAAVRSIAHGRFAVIRLGLRSQGTCATVCCQGGFVSGLGMPR